MKRDAWIKDIIGKQPTFDSKDAAIKAAIEANKDKSKVFEVWKEPKARGGRYVVAEAQSFETLDREGYNVIVDLSELFEIEQRGHINKTAKAPQEGINGIDRWTSNGYGITIGGKKVTPPTIDEIEEI